MTPIRRLHRVMSVLVALVLGYSGHAAGQGTEAERRCRQIDALAAQLRCLEQITIATNPGRALRYGSGVFITTERRIHARIDWPGTPASPDTAHFYQGLEPRLNAHQLRVVILSGRSGHHELIHQRTGQVTLLAGQPAISPDGKYFIAAGEGTRAYNRPSEIQVWRINPDGFSMVAKFTPPGWHPRSGEYQWASEGQVQITRHCRNSTGEDAQPCGIAEISHSGASWKISG